VWASMFRQDGAGGSRRVLSFGQSWHPQGCDEGMEDR
jgi:hypothetical protein